VTQNAAVKRPQFALNKELARYVPVANRLKNNRPAVISFLDPPSSDPDREYLSVNSLEIESLAVIADYYRLMWQGSRGDVSVCSLKVFDFNEAGKKSGVDLQFDRTSEKWHFGASGGVREDAYKVHPRLASSAPQSASHCGVEFVRALKGDYYKLKFARRLATKRFHIVKSKPKVRRV
jgi:hypothetical protein